MMVAALAGVLAGVGWWFWPARHDGRPEPGFQATHDGSNRSRRPGRLPRRAFRRRAGPHAAVARQAQPAGRVSIAEVVDLIRLALSSGLSSGAALSAVADTVDHRSESQRANNDRDVALEITVDPIARELRSVAAALAWGMDADQAWAQVDGRWRPVRQAMVLADRSGVPAASLLEHAAVELRRNKAAELEVQAAKLPVRLVIPLGLLYLPAFMLITVVPMVIGLARSIIASW